MNHVKIVCVSDTHENPPDRVPDCDILIHAGDATLTGNWAAIKKFNDWLEDQPAKHKIFVPGNHDMLFESNPGMAKGMVPAATVLLHEAVEVMGVKIFGSPWTPRFYDWAYNYDPGQAERLWDQIPEGIDVLITHGPPAGILDTAAGGKSTGCPVLLDRVMKVDPILHVFGHIHECGQSWQVVRGISFINAACVDRAHNRRPDWQIPCFSMPLRSVQGAT